MYEICLVMNILCELAVGVWPLAVLLRPYIIKH